MSGLWKDMSLLLPHMPDRAQGGAAALPCCYALSQTKPSSWKQSLESHSGPFAALMRMFKTCWRFVQAEPVGYISVGVAAAAPVMVWSCKIPNSLGSTAKSPTGAAQPRLEIPTPLGFKSFWVDDKEFLPKCFRHLILKTNFWIGCYANNVFQPQAACNPSQTLCSLVSH